MAVLPLGTYEKDLEDFADRLAVERMHYDRDLAKQFEFPEHVTPDRLSWLVHETQRIGHQLDRSQIQVAHQGHQLARKNAALTELQENCAALQSESKSRIEALEACWAKLPKPDSKFTKPKARLLAIAEDLATLIEAWK